MCACRSLISSFFFIFYMYFASDTAFIFFYFFARSQQMFRDNQTNKINNQNARNIFFVEAMGNVVLLIEETGITSQHMDGGAVK